MKLTDLEPRWLLKNGARVGFIFKSPTNQNWFQSCFVERQSYSDECDLFNEAVNLPDDSKIYGYSKVQGCKAGCVWSIEGGIENAKFESITVKPSLDGSPGGLWHGFIKNGEIA